MTRIIATLAVTVGLAAALSTAPTFAQSQHGLVNVNISDITTGDILSDINVGVGAALNLAANVCGVSVGVLAQQLGQQGSAVCSTDDQEVILTRLIND
jgi:hypothetical protein